MFGITWKSVEKKIKRDFGEVPTIDTEELATLLAGATGRKPILFDVREPEEYAVSQIPGAIRVDSAKDAKRIVEQVGFSGPVVAYCSVGYRSAKLVNGLLETGITEAFNLRGSIFKWANEGRRITRGDQEALAVHPFDRKWGRLLDPSLHSELDS